jgi:hypothetical protein
MRLSKPKPISKKKKSPRIRSIRSNGNSLRDLLSAVGGGARVDLLLGVDSDLCGCRLWRLGFKILRS